MKFQNVLAYLRKDVREVGADLAKAGKALMVAGGIAVASIVAPSGDAVAAVPAAATTAFTDMSDDFTTIFGFGYAALIIIVVAMIAWKYTKKLGSKL